MTDFVCLDTRILTMYLKGKKTALNLLNNLKKEDTMFYTTVINISEFYMGYYKTNIMTEEKNAKLQEFFTILHPKNLDYASAELAGKLYATALKSDPIGWRDTYIASIVLLNGKKIITSNKKHFKRVPQLDIIEYQ